MILYPSTHYTGLEPVTSGVRMVVLWVQSMIRSAWKSMFFELDNTIQSLRVKHGRHRSLNLSIHYHKLIQEWAELWKKVKLYTKWFSIF